MKLPLFILLILAALRLFEPVNAQTYFVDFLKESGLSFKKPAGYTLNIIDNYDEYEYDCQCYKPDGRPDLVAGDFYLYNADKSVIIQIEDYGYDENNGWPYWLDDNKMFFNNASNKADTSKRPVRFYNATELKPLNADAAVEFSRNCSVPGNPPGYRSYRFISVSKAYQANFTLIYMFKDTLKAGQDKIINETKHMLTFNVNKNRTFSKAALLKKYRAQLNLSKGMDSLPTLWNRGTFYKSLFYFSREQYAISVGNAVISIQFPVNPYWPYNNSRIRPPFFANNPQAEAWLSAPDKQDLIKANQDFKKYGTLAAGATKALTTEQLKTMGADAGYAFDFEADSNDLYRDKYRKCKVIVAHKNNLGTLIIKYYYISDTRAIDQLITKTHGFAKFINKNITQTDDIDIYPF